MARLHRAVLATKVFPIIGADAPKHDPSVGILERHPERARVAYVSGHCAAT